MNEKDDTAKELEKLKRKHEQVIKQANLTEEHPLVKQKQ
jgi:hypothetical protein